MLAVIRITAPSSPGVRNAFHCPGSRGPGMVESTLKFFENFLIEGSCPMGTWKATVPPGQGRGYGADRG